MITGHLDWNPTSLWTLGGDVTYFDNSKTWPLHQLLFHGFVNINLKTGYLVQLSYRHVNYTEELEGRNNYSADIVEIGIGYKW